MSHDLPATRWAYACMLSIEKALGRPFSGEEAAKVQGALLNPSWQPIASAPKDETAILLYCPNFYWGAGVYVGWWSGSYFDVCTEGNTERPYSDDGATHWMPMPPPPPQEQA